MSYWWVVGGVAFLAVVRWLGRKRYLGGFDAIQLNSDPELITTVHGLMVMKNEFTLARLRECIGEAFLKHDRFKQIAVRSEFLWPYWKFDENFRLENHVIEHVMEPSDEKLDGGDDAEYQLLQKTVSSYLSKPLDGSRPLWTIILLRPYKKGSVVLFRFHHCLADGIAMMRVILSALEPVPLAIQEQKSDSAPAAAPPQVEKKEKKRESRLQMFSSLMRSVARLLLLPADPITCLRAAKPMAPLDPRVAAWTDVPLDLLEVKALAKRLSDSLGLHISINDVLLSALTGCLRQYVVNRHGASDSALKQPIQTVIWVSLRALDLKSKRIEWGNNLGAVYFSLPLTIQHPIERLQQVSRQVSALKTSPEPLVAQFLCSLFGYLPACIARPLWHVLAYKVTVSMSNVPGPQEYLAFGGNPIQQFLFMVPAQRTLGHFVCIMSYNGGVTFGLNSDPRLLPDPQTLVTLFRQEIQLLKDKLNQ
eukprot:TRINITY_DN825_c0_g1_i1.p1 TRINITY_DN825_c0_g1~~TRINITY_DN825_c0_g1_i1.p1  ORF type:complete len:477 (+),score=126.02 TRINITY_DN825_c0_g1_i1:88-1518(+)